MLVIRMQRTGRKGHAMFRVVVQDSRRTPTSGKVVALLGSYDPHTKAITLDKEKTQKYLDHGAQPTDRVVALLEKEGVKLPKWVKKSADKKRDIRNPEKLRRNQPAEEKAPEVEAAESPAEAEVSEEAPAETEAAPVAEAAEAAEPAEEKTEA